MTQARQEGDGQDQPYTDPYGIRNRIDLGPLYREGELCKALEKQVIDANAEVSRLTELTEQQGIQGQALIERLAITQESLARALEDNTIGEGGSTERYRLRIVSFVVHRWQNVAKARAVRSWLANLSNAAIAEQHIKVGLGEFGVRVGVRVR